MGTQLFYLTKNGLVLLQCSTIGFDYFSDDRSEFHEGVAIYEAVPTCGVTAPQQTCHCVFTGGLGEGNCVGVYGFYQGWCFLGHFVDPMNPKEGCYEDMQWSWQHGRYWSYQACRGLHFH